MNLDEFNLVCYTTMYSVIQSMINFINNNQGNLFEKYVSIITVNLTWII